MNRSLAPDAESHGHRIAWRYAAVVATVGDSLVLRALERSFNVVVTAFGNSAIVARVVALYRGLPPDAAPRVRLAGCLVFSAATVHVLLVGFHDLLRPPVAGLGWIVILPMSLVCICLPHVVVAAWETSRTVRSLRGRVR
ncbi:MAG: hypothetical protein O2930_14305 [Acidobacteria bacterium]|nr:hypothetical protein [Acidobacteriota bacterium]